MTESDNQHHIDRSQRMIVGDAPVTHPHQSEWTAKGALPPGHAHAGVVIEADQLLQTSGLVAAPAKQVRRLHELPQADQHACCNLVFTT